MKPLFHTDECFGREPILNLLKKRVLDLKDGYRQNVAILGHPYVGKSAVLHHFASYLKDERVVIVYLDFEHPDFLYFVRKLSFSLLSQYVDRQDLSASSDLNALMEISKKKLPQTVAVIADILRHAVDGKTSTAFAGLLTLPEIFSNESGRFCVLMLDEFQNLETFDVPQVFQKLGKKIMTQTKCFYVLASSYPQAAKKILSEDLSLLFGNFEIIELDVLDHASCCRCIEGALQGYSVAGAVKNFLIDFCAGYPLYLQIISREIKYLSVLCQQKDVHWPILSQAVENTVFDRLGLISRHFELKMMELSEGRANRFMADLLLHLSEGNNKRDLLEEKLSLNKSSVKTKLQRLTDQGIIAKNGDFYYFQDKLFRYWIKYVYQRRFKAIDVNGQRERMIFRDEFKKAYDHFTAQSSKNPASRMTDLLHAIHEGTFSLNGRRYDLPRFRDIAPVPVTKGDGHPMQTLKASATDQNWLIALKDSCFDEDDVNSLISEMKKKGRKPLKGMIVALDKIDEQAKLRALEEKCWVLNREEINVLFGIFDKTGFANHS